LSQEFGLQGDTSAELAFFDQHIEEWVNDTIISDTKSVAAAANLPASYIDSIKFIKTGVAKGKVVNTHPAWKYLENGTKPHKITTKGGPNAISPPRKLKIPVQIGAINGFIFPTEVDHPGNRPYLIMTKGKELGFPRFLIRVRAELDNFRRNQS